MPSAVPDVPKPSLPLLISCDEEEFSATFDYALSLATLSVKLFELLINRYPFE